MNRTFKLANLLLHFSRLDFHVSKNVKQEISDQIERLNPFHYFANSVRRFALVHVIDSKVVKSTSELGDAFASICFPFKLTSFS